MSVSKRRVLFANRRREDGGDTIPPETPDQPVIIVDGDTALTVDWEPVQDTGGSGLNGYRIDRSNDDSVWEYLTFVGSGQGVTHYNDTGLSPGTEYFYRLRAKDNAGNFSDWSLSASGTTSGGEGEFVLQFEDQFIGGSLGNKWNLYNGAAQLDQQGPRWKGNVEFDQDPDEGQIVRLWVRQVPYDVEVYGGQGKPPYTIHEGEWSAAGMNLSDNDLTYGAYEVKAKAGWPAGSGSASGGRLACLLWPRSGGWPPELDWFEAGGGSDYAPRQKMKISNWRKEGDGQAHDEWVVNGDFTEWHVFRVEWTPGKFVIKIDGVIAQIITTHVPSRDMWIGWQTAIEGGCYPDGTPKRDDVVESYLDVAWLKIYSYNP